jgi:hypothetical protein
LLAPLGGAAASAARGSGAWSRNPLERHTLRSRVAWHLLLLVSTGTLRSLSSTVASPLLCCTCFTRTYLDSVSSISSTWVRNATSGMIAACQHPQTKTILGKGKPLAHGVLHRECLSLGRLHRRESTLQKRVNIAEERQHCRRESTLQKRVNIAEESQHCRREPTLQKRVNIAEERLHCRRECAK